MNASPIGCCALAGTTYDTDRYFEASKLGFDKICMNINIMMIEMSMSLLLVKMPFNKEVVN